MFPEEPEVTQEVAVEAEEPAVVEAVEAAEPDTLAQIEERILRAVELVNKLRQERDAAILELGKVRGEHEQSEAAGRGLSDEVVALKAERQQVRSRLERLLGHIDQLG